MLRMVFCDVDGTLLPAGQTEPDGALLQRLQTLLERGVAVVIASGRPLYNLRHLFAPLSDRLYFIAHDGAVCAHGERVLSVRPIGGYDLQAALSFPENRSADLILSTATDAYLLRAPEEMVRAMATLHADRIHGARSPREIPDPICKIAFHRAEPRPVLPPCPGLRRCVGHSDWCELVSRYVNKGSAAAGLQARLFVSPSETAAVGNDVNDLELLSVARTAAVVAESPLAACAPAHARIVPSALDFLEAL
jgi:HAD superfamily hydrolase (TIGR01484 family)